jgi:hypothetical protein
MALHDASMRRLMEALDLISRLVAVDSVNPTLVPGGAGEGEIAVFVRGRGSVHAWAAVEAEIAVRLCG